MNRACIIFNPAARGEKARRLFERLRTTVGDSTIRVTEYPGDAEAQTERAIEQGFRIVVAAGGDGTVNEVVNGLNGTSATLGILPLGTINVFAMELGIPIRLERAWEVIQRGKTRKVDLPRVGEQRFVQLAGVGLDAEILTRTHWWTRKTFGPLSYLLAAFGLLARAAPLLNVTINGEETHQGRFLLVGNGRYYGGRFPVFPDAKLDDGLLDGCLFAELNAFAVARYLQGVLARRHTQFSDVFYFQAERLTVESDRPVPLEVDGELYGHTPCSFSISPAELEVIVP
ncbi:diacylglycerol kinase (ATP) [Methylacidimicrobium cyclopophantes]|uniref:Diacylglycerol kinase (ATP) n=1 Tax=Methylacidimicrobium cyclopophantes TaxID=1041766 RepID=A0A5E6MDH3_9BACT|nr:diacylglycerol kinase family protein [Methylacidimicrobium cyclopophantes]VVM05872.1 diacylglycerol kinase (ATP) [Methylacidimicrobium cyclopophantes]